MRPCGEDLEPLRPRGPVPHPKTASRIKRQYRTFENRSVYQTLVLIHILLAGNGQEKDWLGARVEPILRDNEILARGITRPRKFQDFTP